MPTAGSRLVRSIGGHRIATPGVALAIALGTVLATAVAGPAAGQTPPSATLPATGTQTSTTTQTPTTTQPPVATQPPAPSYQATPPTRGTLASDGPTDRYLLGGTWLYRPDRSKVGLAQRWWRGAASTTGWTPVTIPNSYNAGDLSAASMAGYVGWYRRDFTLPAHAFPSYVPSAARSWVIEFESVDYTATVWLNGHRLGRHTGAYLSFELPLSRLRGGVNRLIVRVSNQRSFADFPPTNNLWWNYGGISDVVYIRAVAGANLDSAVIRPILPCPHCSATIEEQATVENPSRSPQRVTLIGSYGPVALRFGAATIAPGGTWTPHASVRLAHPRLWAPGSPNLYHATLSLTDSHGRTIGGYRYESGVRSIRRTGNGLLELNGRLLHLRGVNIHLQNLATGEALSLAQMQQIMTWARALGATVIRAHVPLTPELEQMADQDGILLWSEVPVYQASRAYVSEASWRVRAAALVARNIELNQNHPSILLWSIGNELPTPPTGGEAAYIALASSVARRLDPTRPVAMAVSDWPGVSCQTAYAPLDVIGINEYFGWFDAGGGGTADRDQLSPFLDTVRQCYPTQPLMITEFGVNANTNGPVEVRGTYPFQVNSTAFHLGVFATKPWLSAAMYYNLQDFAARPGWDGANPSGIPPIVTNGLLDVYGNPKPAFPTVSSMFHATAQIAPP